MFWLAGNGLAPSLHMQPIQSIILVLDIFRFQKSDTSQRFHSCESMVGKEMAAFTVSALGPPTPLLSSFQGTM